MYIFLTIKKGRKEYYATVSSFHYSEKDLWLFIWNDEKSGVKGNCGYIPNGKVTEACFSTRNHPVVSSDTLKIIKGW